MIEQDDEMKHREWVKGLASGAATLRDDRGMVRAELLARLSHDERFRLSQTGAYGADELWPELCGRPPYEAVCEWLHAAPAEAAGENEEGNVGRRANDMCAGCWGTLASGVPDYAALIDRVAADLRLAAGARGRPPALKPHLRHALERVAQRGVAGAAGDTAREETRFAEWKSAAIAAIERHPAMGAESTCVIRPAFDEWNWMDIYLRGTSVEELCRQADEQFNQYGW